MAKGDKPRIGGKPELTAIIEAFTNHWGLAPEPKISQRRYASHLERLYGDRVLDVVNYALSIQNDPYAPQITSPQDLYYKHLKVMQYYRNNNNDSNRVLKV